uniref:Uncharacterized protein n=1 Tax=Pithovirus LCPAC401 TaxID=2506595 RepID=A0A481ZC57_9VIRU|nr:MAG: hypothetical protein LCPAC401_03070 [Pithovirus LCPAC401]
MNNEEGSIENIIRQMGKERMKLTQAKIEIIKHVKQEITKVVKESRIKVRKIDPG